MEGRDLQSQLAAGDTGQIIEYLWAHKMMDIQVVDYSLWPEVDSKPLSLEDSWRLRVVSAQVYSILKNRDMEHFEKVMDFLEATYRLVPTLLTPIKHMKILFGLKTMVIMWMLRAGRGVVDTLIKIIQFFPSKLSQYQNQCNQREMFLMRKNHLDFRNLAQALAMDKDKLEDYIKNQLEEQYGERYAQKVEDRLLHYLHELEAVLPRDTYIDKILKKNSPVTEEEKLLLDVITSDSISIAAMLKKLLHCAQLRSEVIRGDEAAEDVCKDGCFLLEEDAELKTVEDESDLAALTATDERRVETMFIVLEKEAGNVSQERNKVGEEEEGGDKEKVEISQRVSECVQDVVPTPQFCSRHQRWVNSILRGCPDECSEELLLQANVSLSPQLFQSSSSTSSSEDLTPSNLTSSPPNQQHPPLQTPCQRSEQGNPAGRLSPGPANKCPHRDPLPEPSSPIHMLLPTLLSPVALFRDIASTFKPHEGSSNPVTISNERQAASTSSLQVQTSSHTSRTRLVQPEIMTPRNTLDTTLTAPLPQDTSTCSSRQPTSPQSFSRVSTKFRVSCTASRRSQAPEECSQNALTEEFRKNLNTFRMSCPVLADDLNVSGPPAHDASTSTALTRTLSSSCTAQQIPLSLREVSPLNADISPGQQETSSHSAVVSLTSSSDCLVVRTDTSRVCRAQLRLSPHSQSVLLQSKLLQPLVSLTRLRTQECHRLTSGRSSRRQASSSEQGGDEWRSEQDTDTDSSFDLNCLYSSHFSSSDSEVSSDSDPDYKPSVGKKRLFLEYVAAGRLNPVCGD